MGLADFVKDNAAVLLLAGAAAGWYAASFTASEALAGSRLALRRRVLGQWLPILAMALVATLAQQTEVALGVLFATSVAALSLVLGIVTIAHEFAPPPAPPGGFPVIETSNPHVVAVATTPDAVVSRARRPWAFILPAALIALLAGFSGRLTGLHAVLLAVAGLFIVSLWNARNELDEVDAPLVQADTRPARGAKVRRTIELLLAIGLAVLASWAGARATRDVSRQLGLVTGEIGRAHV